MGNKSPKSAAAETFAVSPLEAALQETLAKSAPVPSLTADQRAEANGYRVFRGELQIRISQDFMKGRIEKPYVVIENGKEYRFAEVLLPEGITLTAKVISIPATGCGTSAGKKRSVRIATLCAYAK